MVKFPTENDPDYRITVKLVYQIKESSDRAKHAEARRALQLKSKLPFVSNSRIETVQACFTNECLWYVFRAAV